MSRRWLYALAPGGIVVALIAGWWFLQRNDSRAEDVRARRAIYSAFPTFPGAVKDHEVVKGITSDSEGIIGYSLEVVYRLPAQVSAAEVLDFFRRNIPPGWTEASDQTCATSLAKMQPPPQPVTGTTETLPVASDFVLMYRRSRLTVFLPGADGSSDERNEGLTFALSRDAGTKYLTLGQPTYSCGGVEADAAAEEFDHGRPGT